MKTRIFAVLIISLLSNINFANDVLAQSVQDCWSSYSNSSSPFRQEDLDKCSADIRRRNQVEKDRVDAEAKGAQELAQKLYDIQLAYFYKLDETEKNLEDRHFSDFSYAQYRLANFDCRQSMRIPSDPTTLDPNVFLSLMENKEKCIFYLLKYTKPASTPLVKPVKSNDQICTEKFGQNWKWISGTTCGCKEGYSHKNGECVNDDQACNISYPNSKFIKIDSAENQRICDCKSGYVWNDQRTGCVVASSQTDNQKCSDKFGANSISSRNDKGELSCGCKVDHTWNEQHTSCVTNLSASASTNDQVCSEAYGHNSIWDGTKNSEGGLICACRAGFLWNAGQNKCVDNIKSESYQLNNFYSIDFARVHSGSILLQVQAHGEAWYVNPLTLRRHYLGRPADAFQIMRELGLGASHDFITRYINGAYPDDVVGRILLDVGDSGKAYYIYPKNKHAYYLGRPADAFKVMRELGLGISNSDLEMIVVN